MTHSHGEQIDRDLHYDQASEVPTNIRKYWYQRHQIFSRYDEGIWITEDGWYGVTPEAVADTIAQHVAEMAPSDKTILIDAFAGVGGNTIAFARSGRWDRIFAIEKDPDTLRCAKHNAAIYGVLNKIWWIEGDCFDIIKKRLSSMGKDAIVFASPPWGGPGYRTDAVFDLLAMEPYSLQNLHGGFTKLTNEMVLYLPRTSDLNQIATFVPSGHKAIVKHYCMQGFSKALCVYFGNLGVKE